MIDMVDDRKAMFVRKALKSVSRLDSNLRAVFARAVHHHHERRSLCQSPRHVGPVGPGQSAHGAAGGHGAYEDTRIGVVTLHAYAVAQNGAAGGTAARGDGEDRDRKST